MPKRLIVCCDGTWNVPDQTSDGRACPTNITKIALSVAPADAAGVEQRMYYHPGVGVSRWDHLRGGAFGAGLSRNVIDAYRFLVESYEPGDDIYLFGFSRGAFTARSTAGLIRNSGILRRDQIDRIHEAYALYRARTAHPRGVEATLFRRSYSHDVGIRFVAVFDTVGALGIPDLGFGIARLFNRRYRFHDTELSTRVAAAFQALAIDEHRRPFRPSVWTQQADAQGQEVEQVWFSGVHCNIGGGYPDSSLSDIALLWIAEKARRHGIEFRPGAFPAGSSASAGSATSTDFSVAPDALGPARESRTGMYRLVPAYFRPVGAQEHGCESVASSAVLRRDKVLGYDPANLAAYLDGPSPRETPV
jgi:uncharacterized protein (DUF2235 family)